MIDDRYNTVQKIMCGVIITSMVMGVVGIYMVFKQERKKEAAI